MRLSLASICLNRQKRNAKEKTEFTVTDHRVVLVASQCKEDLQYQRMESARAQIPAKECETVKPPGSFYIRFEVLETVQGGAQCLQSVAGRAPMARRFSTCMVAPTFTKCDHAVDDAG